MTIKDLKEILNKFDENQPVKFKELIREPHYLGWYSKIYSIEEVSKEHNCICFKLCKSADEMSNVYSLPKVLENL